MTEIFIIAHALMQRKFHQTADGRLYDSDNSITQLYYDTMISYSINFKHGWQQI